MSNINSSADHLTLNADGVGKDVKFNCNGVEKASIDSSGNFTSTSIDATKLTGALPAIDGSALTGVGGKVVQVVHVQDGTVATGTTIFPFDNTIPQNTEGDQYMSLAITPTSATNKLKIEVCMNMSSDQAAATLYAALFQDATASALSVAFYGRNAGLYSMTGGTFSHIMTAGTTSATTFKVRAGLEFAGTTTFNGNYNNAKYGGKLASTITITEYEV